MSPRVSQPFWRELHAAVDQCVDRYSNALRRVFEVEDIAEVRPEVMARREAATNVIDELNKAGVHPQDNGEKKE